jgi:PIN domain nuclease of toxin-antitoxin system
MGQNRITLDTHTLIWYVHEPSKNNLSPLALEAIRSAERDGIIYVPAIALLEVLSVIEKGKYPLVFELLLSDLERSTRYQVIPFDVKLLRVTANVEALTLHDRVIAATAISTNSLLISKDRAIRASGVTVVW